MNIFFGILGGAFVLFIILNILAMTDNVRKIREMLEKELNKK